MKRYILTGTPGCGKTSIIEVLKLQGYNVIPEAATDVIAHEQQLGEKQPWLKPNFIDNIIKLQKKRQINADILLSKIQFYDRSPICTYALATYLGFDPSMTLLAEIERIQANTIYQQEVFFLENLGFIINTDARKISFEESLKFEKIHLDTYTKFGYKCMIIPAAPIIERVSTILRLI